MLEWLRSLRGPDEWTDIINALVIFIGSIIAVNNLRVIAKMQRLESIREFFKDLADTVEDRKFVIQKFNSSSKKLKLTPGTERKIQNVVNFLNRVGLLLEKGLLSPQLVFGIFYTGIIRCCYKLESYRKYHESRIGGRYGRRIGRLAKRAERYHDSNPQYRVTKIKIDPGSGKEPFIVYQTTIEKGLDGIKQKISWIIRRFFRIY